MLKGEHNYIQYAKSIFQIAKEENKIDKFYNDIKFISDSMKTDDISLFFSDRFIPLSDKLHVIEKIFKNKCEKSIFNFICLLCENDMLSCLCDIENYYQKLCDEEQNRAYVIITTAYEVKDKESIINAVSSIIGNSNMRVEFNIDISLIGGIKIEADNILYDYSIKHNLDSMRLNVGNTDINKPLSFII